MVFIELYIFNSDLTQRIMNILIELLKYWLCSFVYR